MNDILYEQSKMNPSFEIPNLKDNIVNSLEIVFGRNLNEDTELDETVFRIMNCIRRTIIDEVEVIAFDSIEINTKRSKDTLAVYNNEYIAQRIRCIPIYWQGDENVPPSLKFSFENHENTWSIMTPMNSTQNAQQFFDDNVYKKLPILYIPAHSSFECVAKINRRKGMSAKYAHAWYNTDFKFFVESIGRTSNTPEGAVFTFNTAIITLIENIQDIQAKNIEDSNTDDNTRYNREFIFENTSRSVMNLIVTLFRYAMYITYGPEQEKDHMYMFSVVQPHMSISDNFRLLVNINRNDVLEICKLSNNFDINAYHDDMCQTMVQCMYDIAIAFLDNLIYKPQI